MRPVLAATVLLAACLVASVATAQKNDRITAQFQSLAASGVVGEVTLNPMRDGEIQFRSTVKGLEPNTEYAVVVYDQSASCGVGTSEVQIATFTSNAAGIANWNERVTLALSSIQSIGIRQEPATTLVACATVPQ